MEQPEPAADMPDGPISAAEAREHLDESGVVTVWVMYPDSDVRSVAVPPGAPDDAVMDIVLETETGYRMYSYTGGQWMDYGTQRKDDDEAPPMTGTLVSYRVLAGDPDEISGDQ
ncbi:hypothetical protein BRC99_06730 [Halobacteriales archaeon QS_7_69_60]|nr:MAG: hypothetical protein BRC99_06730 [Halobacteriales archaeon QS_7_69_60]